MAQIDVLTEAGHPYSEIVKLNDFRRSNFAALQQFSLIILQNSNYLGPYFRTNKLVIRTNYGINTTREVAVSSYKISSLKTLIVARLSYNNLFSMINLCS